MGKKTVLFIILTVSLLVGAAGGSYHWYQITHYIQTEDSKIAGDIYKVMPRSVGKLHSLQVAEGDWVTPDQVIGRQDFVSLSTSQLDQAVLRSASTGTVIKLTAKPGEVVSPGQPVAMIVNKQELYITANIKDEDARKVYLGQSADFTVDAYPGKTFSGKVLEIGEATSTAFSPMISAPRGYTKVTQIIPVKISIEDQHGLNILPGMSTVVKIHL